MPTACPILSEASFSQLGARGINAHHQPHTESPPTPHVVCEAKERVLSSPVDTELVWVAGGLFPGEVRSDIKLQPLICICRKWTPLTLPYELGNGEEHEGPSTPPQRVLSIKPGLQSGVWVQEQVRLPENKLERTCMDMYRGEGEQMLGEGGGVARGGEGAQSCSMQHGKPSKLSKAQVKSKGSSETRQTQGFTGPAAACVCGSRCEFQDCHLGCFLGLRTMKTHVPPVVL